MGENPDSVTLILRKNNMYYEILIDFTNRLSLPANGHGYILRMEEFELERSYHIKLYATKECDSPKEKLIYSCSAVSYIKTETKERLSKKLIFGLCCFGINDIFNQEIKI